MLTASRRHRSSLLDCIRAVAILLVVAFHATILYDFEELDAVGQFFRQYGSKGVDIFFPLSGYLISRFLLSTEGGAAIRTFFLRRAFRILPLYLLAVTLYVAAMILLGHDRFLLDRIWINYTFLTGWFIFYDGAASVPYTLTWSLSVEEFSYIVFGLMAWFSRKLLPLGLILLCIAPAILRYELIAQQAGAIYYFPPTRIDSIAIGGVVAWAMMHRPAGTVLAALAGALALSTAVLLLDAGDQPLQETVLWQTLIYTNISLVTCFLIVLFETSMKGIRSTAIDQVAAIGFYSYFTYLFHFFNIYALEIFFARTGIPLPGFWVFLIVLMVVTQIQAVLSHRLFEGPMMRYGRSLERHEARPAAGQAKSVH